MSLFSLTALFVLVVCPAYFFFGMWFKVRNMELQLKMRELNLQPSDLGWPEEPSGVWSPRRIIMLVVMILCTTIAPLAISRYLVSVRPAPPLVIRPHRQRFLAAPPPLVPPTAPGVPREDAGPNKGP